MAGGGQTSAQRAAEQRDAETSARITQNTQRVNSIFDSPERQAQIADFTNAARGLYREELDRQKGVNDNQLTFAMARSGQTGGSLDKDKHVELGKNYQRGIVNAEQHAQGAASELRASDEDSRARLTAMVQSGGDIGTASANAATTLRNNLLGSRAGLQAKDLGDSFSGLAETYAKSKQQSEYRRGLFDYLKLYAPTFGFGGNAARTR